MRLVDVLPRNDDGQITLSPAGKHGDQLLDGTVDPGWFEQTFAELANAPVPLLPENFDALCGIDWVWEANALRWRNENLI